MCRRDTVNVYVKAGGLYECAGQHFLHIITQAVLNPQKHPCPAGSGKVTNAGSLLIKATLQSNSTLQYGSGGLSNKTHFLRTPSPGIIVDIVFHVKMHYFESILDCEMYSRELQKAQHAFKSFLFKNCISSKNTE